MGQKDRKKIPPSALPTGGQSKSVVSSDVTSIMSVRPSWQLDAVQLKDSFGWEAISREKFLNVLTRLKDIEKMTWGEIQKDPKSFHSVRIADLETKARHELNRLKLDDQESLFSIRISGRERVWAIKNGPILRVLWWDPEHQVCPSQLKHT